MEYALFRKAAEEGYYKKADRFGDCVRSFIKPKNYYAYSTSVQMLVSSKSLSSWYLIYSYGPLLYSVHARCSQNITPSLSMHWVCNQPPA